MKDGVQEFHLVAEPVKREFAPGMMVNCWGYNGQSPGPTIEAVEGERVSILVTNKPPQPTTVHWHAFILPDGTDGLGGVAQHPHPPGRTESREYPPRDVPPLTLVRPDIPVSVAKVLARALKRNPAERFYSVAGMLRELDRAVGSHTSMFTSGSMQAAMRGPGESEEARLRWAPGEDYEVIGRLGGDPHPCW